MQQPQAKLKQIRRILALWPMGAADDGEQILRDYLLAVDDYPAGDVEHAVDQLVKGTAPGVNPSFRPKPSETGAECRRQMELRVRSMELERIHRPRLPPPQIEHTPEARERILAMAKAATERLTAPTTAEELTKVAERRERADAEIRARVASGEMLEMPGSSFPVSQTLAKQLGYEVDREERGAA